MRDSASLLPIALVLALTVGGCTHSESKSVPSREAGAVPSSAPCQAIGQAYGPLGTVPVHMDRIASGLEVPWGIAFLPSGNLLVTERPGRIRLIQGGILSPTNVAEIQTGESNEGGLLGIVLDPQFTANQSFYIFYTVSKNGGNVNRVQKYLLSKDETQAVADKILIDDIPAGTFHNGGRLRIGPDGDLYIGTGDSRNPDLAQDPSSPNGKLLRIKTDGSLPQDNPVANLPYFLLGLRNLEAFDWLPDGTLILADNGPTGELGLTGQDKIAFASSGGNLGWPKIHLCETAPGLIAPALTWVQAVPPGGAAIYQGREIPEWKGDLLVGVLGMDGALSHNLHRIMFAKNGSHAVVGQEVYFQGEDLGGNSFGRLRDVITGPDGELYVTTSNCDSRGTCPAEKDLVLKVRRGP